MSKFKFNLLNTIVHILYLALIYATFVHIPQEYVLGKIICIFVLIYSYLYFLNNSKSSLQKSEQFQAILDALPGFVSWINRDLVYLGVNSKMCSFFGLSEKDFIGQQLGEMTEYHNEFLIDKANELFNSSKSMIQCEIEFEKDNKKYWNLLTLQKYNNDQNAVLISIDITELKEAQEVIKLEEAKVMHNERLVALGEMATTIAHEINNPLTLISGSNSILAKHVEKGTVTDEKLRSIIEKNKFGLKRVRDIIKGIQNLARDGRNEKKESSSLNGILDDVLIFQTKKCNDHNIDLVINRPEDDIIFDGVPVQVGQVIIILLNNAIDAIEKLDQKWIKLDVNNNSDSFEIIITDSGAGIPEESAKKIFDSFFTTKAIGKGTGIGLHLAKKIMDFHNGEIIINMDSANTQFILKFPKIEK